MCCPRAHVLPNKSPKVSTTWPAGGSTIPVSAAQASAASTAGLMHAARPPAGACATITAAAPPTAVHNGAQCACQAEAASAASAPAAAASACTVPPANSILRQGSGVQRQHANTQAVRPLTAVGRAGPLQELRSALKIIFKYCTSSSTPEHISRCVTGKVGPGRRHVRRPRWPLQHACQQRKHACMVLQGQERR